MTNRRYNRRRNRRGERGMALIMTFVLLGMLVLLGASLLGYMISGVRQARNDEVRAVVLQLSEAGMERLLYDVWKPLREDEAYTWHDANLTGASATVGQWRGLIRTNLNGGTGWRFAAGVTGYTTVNTYARDLVLRSVGWIDLNGNGGSVPDNGEPSVTTERRIRLTLEQAHVFDYAYFANNYGWMTGFNTNSLWVNGDMRANGDFNIDGGTVNGQIIAAANPNLQKSDGTWGAPGNAIVTSTANIANGTYNASVSSRARRAYDPDVLGAKDSASFEAWKELIYDQTPDPGVSVSGDILYGSVIADQGGTRQLSSQSTYLGTQATNTLPMPDLRDINYYRDGISAAYTDPKATYLDGTVNPDAGQPAYLEVWDTATSSYKRLTGQAGDPSGVISGSAGLIGTTAHPIRIHGPVTVMGDVAIKGVVEGQGTLYTGRNIHIIGSVTYADPPNFQGSSPASIDAANEKKTVMALCARGSVIMGNTKTFGSNPLNYMKPPFTKARKDDITGNIIPAFDATQLDSGYTMKDPTTGANLGTPKKYQSLLGDSWINTNSSALTQLDAVVYTNNVAGGNIGDGTSSGFTINGSIITKDEAMVLNSSGRLTFNYDSRIKERSLAGSPLIDIRLPRIPRLIRSSWKEVTL